MATAITCAPRARTSATFESTLSRIGIRVATHTTGVFSSSSAIGPCFISPAGVGVGRDVGDLLELERALERHRQADVAAEVEEELGVLPVLGDLLHAARRPARSCGSIWFGSALQLGDQRAAQARARACRAPGRASARAGTSTITWETKVFVAATPISRPARVNSTPSESRVAWRAHHVRDRQHARAVLAREAHRGERVGGLARLGDADHEVVLADDRVAVAVLGGDVHLDRHARPRLDRVAADEAGVVAGAAGDDHDPAQVAQDSSSKPMSSSSTSSPARGRTPSRPRRPAARGSP